MGDRQWKINVANPSPYYRSDYVEIDLNYIGVDYSVDTNSLHLLHHLNGNIEEIPFQIDYPLGENVNKRTLTFFTTNIPPGKDDYSEVAATYLLVEQKSGKPQKTLDNFPFNIDYYYTSIDSSESYKGDGFDTRWLSDRSAYGVKLRSNALELYILLMTNGNLYTDENYTGSITSVLLKKAHHIYSANPDNMLCPHGESSKKKWGQITKLVFYPPPWQMEWYFEKSLLETNYKLLYSNVGPMRAIVTLISEPFALSFNCEPLFKDGTAEVRCNLHRIFTVYPGKPFYIEELFVLTDKGHPISFRPYYLSFIDFLPNVYTSLARIENIPDYFAYWKYFHPEVCHGYGFASNSHVRQLEIKGNEIQWRLQLNFHHRAIHYFMFNDTCNSDGRRDLFHVVGHSGWYEKIFKPLEMSPVKPFQHVKRYMSM